MGQQLPNYPNNRETGPPAVNKRVTKGKVRAPKVSGEVSVAVRKATNGLFEEFIVPSIQNMVANFFAQGVNSFGDIFTESIRRMIFGGGGNSPGGSSYRNNAGFQPYSRSYNSLYREPTKIVKSSRQAGREPERISRPQNIEDLVFQDPNDAQTALDHMHSYIHKFKAVRVGDLYDFVGLSSPHTYQRWGWTNLYGARVESINAGYILTLPELELLTN